MKIISTFLLSVCCLAASAQKKSHNNFSQHIHDDGKTMSIVIEGNSDGRTVNYNRTFNVTGMSPMQKDALTKRITDSLGMGSVHRPKQSKAPVGPVPPPSTPLSDNKHEAQHVNSDIDDDGKTMHIKINGSQRNRTFNYDRTFEVKGMTAKEKNALAKHITDSLGVTKNVQLSTN